MKKKSVKVSAPATVANVACGFDILGFAIDGPSDEITASLSDKKGVHVKGLIGKIAGIPKSASILLTYVTNTTTARSKTTNDSVIFIVQKFVHAKASNSHAKHISTPAAFL